MNPLKSITTISPFLASPSLICHSAWLLSSLSNLSSTSASVTSTSSFLIPKCLYSPNSTFGLTVTTASNVTPFSLLISLTSISGIANGETFNSSIALV